MKIKIIVEVETGSKEIRNAVMGAYCITQDIINPDNFRIQYDKTTLVGVEGINMLFELLHKDFRDKDDKD